MNIQDLGSIGELIAAVDARVARGGLGNPLEWPMNMPDGVDAH